MRGRFFLSLLLALTLVLPAASLPTAEAGSTATMSQPLEKWLTTAGATDKFNTIITFYGREGLPTLDLMGVKSTKLNQLPIAFAKLTPPQIRTLAGSSSVRSLWHEQKMDLYLDESVPLTKADQVQAGSGLRTPYTGAGVSVAVIDTGVDGLHPDLPAGAKVEGYANAGNPDVFDSGDSNPQLLVPAATGDTYGHGTHVASTIAGLGLGATGADGDGDGDADRFVGMAPGAKIYAFKTDVGAFLAGGWILASFDWILAYNANPANTQKIKVSSNSWGCCDGSDYRPDDPVNVATKALYDSGVNVVFAASNSGAPNTLNQYATSPWVISAAAGTKNLGLASFSSRGRFDDENGTVDINWDRRKAQRSNTGIYRPTITAPGEDIEAAKSSQATIVATGVDPVNPLYTYASGTSMATPHVAGAVALMLQARPLLKPQNVIDILEGSADNMPAYEIFEVGMGHLDALEAVQAAEKGKIKWPPPVNGATPEFTRLSAQDIRGEAITNTWALVEQEAPSEKCKDDNGGLFSHHQFTVTAGTDAVYAEIDWDQGEPYDTTGPTDLIYLRLYTPDCSVAAESAALLDIGDVNHRAVLVSSPVPGTWTVGVYGRVNAPTPGINPDTGLPYKGTAYAGAIGTYDKN